MLEAPGTAPREHQDHGRRRRIANLALIPLGRRLDPGARPAGEPSRSRPGIPANGGLLRPRLAVALDALWSKRVCLVIAPPGSGKTTLLAGWASRCRAPVAWYSAEATDASAGTLVAQLQASLSRVITMRRPWGTMEEAIADISAHPDPAVVLVVDDLHVLAGTPAEAALARLLAVLPPNMFVLAATRQAPALSLSRLRLDDSLIELSGEDLRFRTWEAEALFREHYRCPMLPDEVSALTRKTEGWAAGLQLFHLATRDRAPAERTRMLGGFGAQTRLVADYLADNVLAGLDGHLVDFMVRTCPLGVLSGELCNELLEVTDSAATLAEMERRQLFVFSHDGGQTYRYHAIMRSHLDGRLVDQMGEAGARQWHYRAGLLLLSESFPEAALRAFSRAEAWERARAVLASLNRGGSGHEGDLSQSCSAAIDTIPARLLDSDPWVGLAKARCHVASGQLDLALVAFRACEAGLPRRAADRCRAEMMAVSAWTNPLPSPAPGWTHVLRRAVVRDPLEALESSETSDPTGGRHLPGRPHHDPSQHAGPLVVGTQKDDQGWIIAGLCVLMAGLPCRAEGYLEGAATPSVSPTLGLGARLAGLLAGLLSRRDPTSLESATRRALAMAGEAERLGSPWLARQAYALLSLTGTPAIAAQVSAQCQRDSDPWGKALAQLLEGAGRLVLGEAPVEVLTLAAAGCRLIGGGVLEAWALACGALAEVRAGNPLAQEAALSAEATARSAGVPGAQALAHLALGYGALGYGALGYGALGYGALGHGPLDARTHSANRLHGRDGRRAVEHLRLARTLAEECGLGILMTPAPGGVPGPRRRHSAELVPAGSPGGKGSEAHHEVSPGPDVGLTLSCFGGLVVRRGVEVVDLSSMRPRARALLALLAMRYPLAVHCEVLTEALWPDADPRTGAHRLQTAVSSLRRALLPPGMGLSAPNPLIRRGEAYVLVADSVDVADFVGWIARASGARSSKDAPAESAALARALGLHRAELLPEFGPADWATRERDRLSWIATDCAERLAELELAAEDPLEALSAARAGLELDRYRESLWRLALRAATLADDHGLAAALTSGRAAALAELGIV